MSRINRWNERTSATRCGGLSLVLVTLGTITNFGSARSPMPVPSSVPPRANTKHSSAGARRRRPRPMRLTESNWDE